MESFAHWRAEDESDAEFLSTGRHAELRWGVERVLPRHEGGSARDLARALQRALRHLPVVMLHDRLLPCGLLAEHVAVGPGGVTVIARWVVADAPAPPIRERVAAVRAVIDEMAPVVGALCLDGEEAAALLRPLAVEGVTVAGPKAIAELAAREGDLHDYELAALVDLLDATLRPAL